MKRKLTHNEIIFRVKYNNYKQNLQNKIKIFYNKYNN